MKMLNKIMLIAGVALAAASCKKEDDLKIVPIVDLGGPTVQRTIIDQWLLDSLTKPYNIRVDYRWDPFEYNIGATLTPPDESNIIPAMQAIKRVWIEPFNAETGSDLFIKKYSPKQLKLVGSVEYQFGTALAGQAEGGNNIAFFDINQNFFNDSVRSITDMIHTSHHEFAHNLDFIIQYPEEFNGISNRLGLRGYTGTWFNIDDQTALESGYLTPYSMASVQEDFAETISVMLMLGKIKFDETVASVNAVAGEALRRKEQIVVNYYRENWNINFYSLQTRVQMAIYTVVNELPVEETYGSDKIYTRASVDPENQTLLPQKASWMALYNEAKDSVALVPDLNLTMDSISMISVDPDASILTVYVSRGTQVFLAQYLYEVSSAGGVYSYTYLDQDENGAGLKDAVSPLLDYFSNNQFTLSFFASPRNSIYPRIKFTPTASPSNYFIALLEP